MQRLKTVSGCFLASTLPSEIDLQQKLGFLASQIAVKHFVD
jgi:hypothetical protein